MENIRPSAFDPGLTHAPSPSILSERLLLHVGHTRILRHHQRRFVKIFRTSIIGLGSSSDSAVFLGLSDVENSACCDSPALEGSCLIIEPSAAPNEIPPPESVPTPMKLKQLLAFVLFAATSCLHAEESGKTVPECPAILSDQKTGLKLEAYRGQVLLIDFWATWCGPCKQSMPFLNALHTQLKDRGLTIIAINVDEDIQDAMDFLHEFPVAYTQSFNPTGECPRTFDVKAMPSSYLVDKQGKIRYVHLGFREGDEAKLRQEIEVLLKE